MNVVTFDATIIHAIKNVLKHGIDAKSAHLSEALAASLGFGSNAALTSALADGGSFEVAPDIEAFHERLRHLIGASNESYVARPEAESAYVQALVYALEFSFSAGRNTLQFDGFVIQYVADACRKLYRARLDAIAKDWRSCVSIARFQPKLSYEVDSLIVKNGRLEFCPIAFTPNGNLPYDGNQSWTDDLLEAVSKADVDRSSKTIETIVDIGTSRILKGLPDLPIEQLLDHLCETFVQKVSELEGVRLALGLVERIDDPMILSKLWDFVTYKLPFVADRSLASFISERNRHYLLNSGDRQVAPFMLRDGTGRKFVDTRIPYAVFKRVTQEAAEAGSTELRIMVSGGSTVISMRRGGVFETLDNEPMTSDVGRRIVEFAYYASRFSGAAYDPKRPQSARILKDGSVSIPDGIEELRMEFAPLPEDGRLLLVRLVPESRTGKVDVLDYIAADTPKPANAYSFDDPIEYVYYGAGSIPVGPNSFPHQIASQRADDDRPASGQAESGANTMTIEHNGHNITTRSFRPGFSHEVQEIPEMVHLTEALSIHATTNTKVHMRVEDMGLTDDLSGKSRTEGDVDAPDVSRG